MTMIKNTLTPVYLGFKLEELIYYVQFDQMGCDTEVLTVPVYKGVESNYDI